MTEVDVQIVGGIIMWIFLAMFVNLTASSFRGKINKAMKPSKIIGTCVWVIMLMIGYLYVIWYFVELYWSLI